MKRARRARWWTQGPIARMCDPITLEPIRILHHPPFQCRADPSLPHDTESDWFDGRGLAAWMVSSRKFTHPTSRREITRDEALALDAYLMEHDLPLNVSNDKLVAASTTSPGVVWSYDRRNQSAQSRRAESLQAESQVGHLSARPPTRSFVALLTRCRAFRVLSCLSGAARAPDWPQLAPLLATE